MYLRTVCVTSVLAHCTVIHSDCEHVDLQEYFFNQQESICLYRFISKITIVSNQNLVSRIFGKKVANFAKRIFINM